MDKHIEVNNRLKFITSALLSLREMLDDGTDGSDENEECIRALDFLHGVATQTLLDQEVRVRNLIYAFQIIDPETDIERTTFLRRIENFTVRTLEMLQSN